LLGGQVAIAGLALMFLLAPDGRFISRGWRYAAGATGLGVLLCTLAVLTSNPTTFEVAAESEEVGPVRTALLSSGFLLISAGLLASVVSMVVRLRRSEGEQRQQVRLIALSAALVAFGLTWLLVAQTLNGGVQTWASSIPLFLSYLLLPS